MAFKTAQENSSDVFELDYTLSGLGFWPFSESPKVETTQDEARWWEITKKFKNLWSEFKGKINNISTLSKLAKSNLSRWKKQPVSVKSREGIARSKETLSLAEELKTKTDKYLPEWIQAEKESSSTPQALNGLDNNEFGVILPVLTTGYYLIIGVPALAALTWSFYKYKDIDTQATLEKRVLDALESKQLTSDQVVRVLGDKNKESDKSFTDKIADTVKDASTGVIVIVGIIGFVVTYLVVKEIKR